MDTMKLRFKKPWAYAVNGVDVLEFSPGVHTVRADVAKQALREGVAMDDKPVQPTSGKDKAKGGSPSNKAKSGPSTTGRTKSSTSGKK